jgi:hypothetical protein
MVQPTWLSHDGSFVHHGLLPEPDQAGSPGSVAALAVAGTATVAAAMTSSSAMKLYLKWRMAS